MRRCRIELCSKPIDERPEDKTLCEDCEASLKRRKANKYNNKRRERMKEIDRKLKSGSMVRG